MTTLLRQARRRFYRNELLLQGANAFCAALFAVILLLLLGTELLDWRWLSLIPLTAAAGGLYWAHRRLPSLYRVAQAVDHRLGLADSLSTALYFSDDRHAAQAAPDTRQCQFEAAAQLSQTVDVRRAVPYTMPRTVYLMAVLFLVASSLFALRYGISRRLDLRPPLALMLQQSLGTYERTVLAKNERRNPQRPFDPQPETAGSGDAEQSAGVDPEGSTEDTAENGSPGKGDAKKQEEADGQINADQEEEGGDQADAKEGSNGNSGQQGDPKSGKPQQSAKQDANNSGESSSLLSKVKDAWQNLLSRMKPQQGNSNSGQQQRSGEQGSKQGKGQPNGGKQSAKNGQPQNSGQEGDSQDGESGEQANNGQDSQGKGTGKSDSAQNSKQPGSGIGSQDGDKNIRQAEQLAAMGKISEILGKRSANITGEATVEVRNTSQQLRTPYAPREAQHGEAGAEISRDEIPVALQPYVEQYFDQVRKQAPAAVKKQ